MTDVSHVNDPSEDLPRIIRELRAERELLLKRVATFGNRLLELEARHQSDENRREGNGLPVASITTALMHAVKVAEDALATTVGQPLFTIAQLDCELVGVLTGTADDVLFLPADPLLRGGSRLGAVRLRIAKSPADTLQR
jgi:hypothetical protein